MKPFTRHGLRHLFTDTGNMLLMVAQRTVRAVHQRGQRVNDAVDRQLAPHGRVDIVVPGDVRQNVLQRDGERAVIGLIAFGRANVGRPVGDVDNDVAIASCRLRGGTEQNRLPEVIELDKGAHAVMNQ